MALPPLPKGATTTPELPQGATTTPPLPQGATTTPQMSYAKQLVFGDYTPAESIKRQLGLTGRYITEGAAGIADLLASPITAGWNQFASPEYQIPTLTEQAKRLPFPQPQTGLEKTVAGASKALVGTGLTAGFAGLAQPVSQTGRAIQTGLASNLPTQAAAATGGGASAELAREAGFGPVGQTAFGLAGGLAGGAFVRPQPTGPSVKQLQNVTRDTALQKGKEVGYSALPRDVGAGKVARTMESISDKIRIEELISANNQQVTNNLARRYLDIPESTPLNLDTLKQAREYVTPVYDKIRNTGVINFGKTNPFSKVVKNVQYVPKGTTPLLGQKPQNYSMTADNAIEQLKELRNTGSAYLTSGKNIQKPDPRLVKLGNEYLNQAKILEANIAKHLDEIKSPELYKEFQDARQYIAKTFTVEKALNPMTGVVDAKNIAKQVYDKDVPITGELKTVADFAKAFPKVTKPIAEPPTPVSMSDYLTFGFGVPADIFTGVPLASLIAPTRIGSRLALSSRLGQQRLVNPVYRLPRTPNVPYQGLLNVEEDIPTIDVGSQQFPIR